MSPSAAQDSFAEHASRSSALTHELRVKQMIMLIRQTPFVSIGSIVNAILVAFVFWDLASRELLIVWSLPILAVAFYAAASWWRRRNRPPPRHVSPRAIHRATALSIASGTLWGLIGLVLFQPDSPLHQVFLAFVLGGMATASVSAHAALPQACVGFVLPCVTPLITRFAMQTDTVPLAAGTMLSLYTASLLFFAWNGYRSFLAGVRVSHENKSLVQRLTTLSRTLEGRVAERTADLLATNENLQREIQERKRAEGDLETVQSRLSAALDAAPDGFSLYDNADRLVLFNSKYREIYSESADAIRLGATFEDIVRYGAKRGQYPDAEGDIDAWVRDRVEAHRNPGAPIEQRLPNGRWLRIVEFKTRDGGVAGFRSDITELKDSEARFRLMAEIAPVPLAFSSIIEGKILYANPALAEMFNSTTEEMIGQPVRSFYVDANDRARMLDILQSEGEVRNFELRVKSARRRPFWVLFSVRQTTFDGLPVLASACSDIDERKAAAEMLRSRAMLSEAAALLGQRALELHDIPELMNETVTAIAETLGIRHCNIYEMTPNDGELALRASMGWEDDDRLRQLRRPEPGSLLAFTLAAHEPIISQNLPSEIRFEPPPFLLEHGIVSSVGLTIPGLGGPLGVVTVHSREPRDFQGHEIDFLQHAANMLGTAIYRNRSEEEQKEIRGQLQHAQKMEAIGTLAGGIAHDFNNILAAIIGYTIMARKRLAEGSREKDQLGEVLHATSRAKELVGQILAFSRKTETEYKRLEIQSVVLEALKLLRATIPATIEIRENIDGSCPAVMADATEIHQVMMNLCTNASHAIGNGVGRLEISLRQTTVDASFAEANGLKHPGLHVVLEVADSGHGMDEETKKRIFDPFFTTKGVGEGTGMGLSAVHGIVTRGGGAILVESELGRGTTFQVFFPAAQDEAGRVPLGGVETSLPRERRSNTSDAA